MKVGSNKHKKLKNILGILPLLLKLILRVQNQKRGEKNFNIIIDTQIEDLNQIVKMEK
jgi:hypothetical protein